MTPSQKSWRRMKQFQECQWDVIVRLRSHSHRRCSHSNSHTIHYNYLWTIQTSSILLRQLFSGTFHLPIISSGRLCCWSIKTASFSKVVQCLPSQDVLGPRHGSQQHATYYMGQMSKTSTLRQPCDWLLVSCRRMNYESRLFSLTCQLFRSEEICI